MSQGRGQAGVFTWPSLPPRPPWRTGFWLRELLHPLVAQRAALSSRGTGTHLSPLASAHRMAKLRGHGSCFEQQGFMPLDSLTALSSPAKHCQWPRVSAAIMLANLYEALTLTLY